jgi:ATP-dependent DNA helicase RecQ
VGSTATPKAATTATRKAASTATRKTASTATKRTRKAKAPEAGEEPEAARPPKSAEAKSGIRKKADGATKPARKKASPKKSAKATTKTTSSRSRTAKKPAANAKAAVPEMEVLELADVALDVDPEPLRGGENAEADQPDVSPDGPADAGDGEAADLSEIPDALLSSDSPIDAKTLDAIRRQVAADSESEDELFELARSLEQDAGEDLEDDAWTQTGPVFDGPVPLDTEEERLAAMTKAARRLGISKLHPEQIEVIDAILTGEDVLMVLPTGFGKSACYQIPSIILEKPVLVISPLLALMKDQYETMNRLGLPCVKLDGQLRGKARKEALAFIAGGERCLVMTTPETLASPDAAEALSQGGISLAAVDEAHCISEWGYDFRPAYLQIGERLKSLGNPPALALTATATEKVRLAIIRFVGLKDHRVVAASPHRDNLAFDVLHCSTGARLRALARLALRVRRPGIIYCSTTRDVDELYTVLQRFGVPSYRYHGKMTASERVKSQEGFMQRGRRTVMIATNAFGLGIDKPDIRYVMHYQSPASLEQYVQEAGRAGRDGRRANCIMLFSPEDRSIHEALLSRSRVRPEQLYRLARALSAWATEEKVPSVEALALSAELGSRTTAALLALMEEGTLVKWDPDAVFVTVPPEEFEQRARALAGQFETLRTQDARRLDAVADYAIDAECRSEFLEEYFGEDSEGACGMCDKCRGQADRPNSFWEPLAPPRGEERGRGRGGKNQRNQRGRKTRGQRQRRGGSAGANSSSGRNARSGGSRASGSRPSGARAGGGRPAEGRKTNANGENRSRPEDAKKQQARRRGRRRGGRGRRRRNPRAPGDSGDSPPTDAPS